MKIRHNGFRENIQESLKAPLTFASCGGGGCGWICFGCGRRRSPDSWANAAMPDGGTSHGGESAERRLSGLPGPAGIRTNSGKSLRLDLYSIISSATPGDSDPSQTGLTTSVGPRGWNCWLLTPLPPTGPEAEVCIVVQQDRAKRAVDRFGCLWFSLCYSQDGSDGDLMETRRYIREK